MATEQKEAAKGRVVPLEEADQRTVSDIVQRAVTEGAPTDARIVGIYVDPPGVCIAVES
ncbi:hypothetical protein ACI797_09155 [Geodermatophilus sp. SYSU D00691]